MTEVGGLGIGGNVSGAKGSSRKAGKAEKAVTQGVQDSLRAGRETYEQTAENRRRSSNLLASVLNPEEDVNPYLTRGLENSSFQGYQLPQTDVTKLGDTYSTGLRDAANTYSSTLGGAANTFSSTLGNAADAYGTGINADYLNVAANPARQAVEAQFRQAQSGITGSAERGGQLNAGLDALASSRAAARGDVEGRLAQGQFDLQKDIAQRRLAAAGQGAEAQRVAAGQGAEAQREAQGQAYGKGLDLQLRGAGEQRADKQRDVDTYLGLEGEKRGRVADRYDTALKSALGVGFDALGPALAGSSAGGSLAGGQSGRYRTQQARQEKAAQDKTETLVGFGSGGGGGGKGGG